MSETVGGRVGDRDVHGPARHGQRLRWRCGPSSPSDRRTTAAQSGSASRPMVPPAFGSPMHVAASAKAALRASVWWCTRRADRSSGSRRRRRAPRARRRRRRPGRWAAAPPLPNPRSAPGRGARPTRLHDRRGRPSRSRSRDASPRAHDRLARPAFVERARAVGRDELERASLTGVGDHLTRDRRGARQGGTSRARRVQACGPRCPTRSLLRSRVGSRRGETDRRLEAHTEAEPSEPTVQRVPRLDEARNGDGRAAGSGHRAVGRPEAGGEPAGAVVPVDVAVLLDQHEQIAPEPAAHLLDDAERGISGDGRVDRAAAATERLERGRRPERRRCGHHDVRRDGGRARDGEAGGDHGSVEATAGRSGRGREPGVVIERMFVDDDASTSPVGSSCRGGVCA